MYPVIPEFFQVSIKAFFIDHAEGLLGNLEGYPFACLRDKKPFLKQVRQKPPVGFDV